MDKGDNKLAIVLLSGGMDSCVTAAVAADEGYELALLHVNYGQRTEARELISFYQIAGYYDVKHRLVADVRYLAEIGGSALTDSRIEVPRKGQHSGGVPASYVPFRNTHLISIAVSWGEVLGAEKIFIGVVEEDAPGYPDCRAEYLESMNALIRQGTRPETNIRVEGPLIKLSKPEIVRLGDRLNAPFELTWSCYRQEDVPCQDCSSCELRSSAFAEAGIVDPLLQG